MTSLKKWLSLHRRRIAFLAVCAFLLYAEVQLTCLWLINQTLDRVYHRIDDCPVREYGMILGCSPYTQGGRLSRTLDERLKSGAALYHAGKIRKIIVSGGKNAEEFYDETGYMKNDLIRRGVPADVIQIDDLGVRTLDSVLRMKHVFGVDDFISVSQTSHCVRTIYLADHYGISTIGFGAADPFELPGMMLSSDVRVPLACIKAVMDVLFHRGVKNPYVRSYEELHSAD